MDAKDIDISKAYPDVNGQNAYHRGPYEAGAADRWYGGDARPNFTFHGRTYAEREMTETQIDLYYRGYQEETGRKNWGK